MRNDTRTARLALAAMIFALGAFCLSYRVLVYSGLEQTSALFVGLPTLLAAIVALSPPARTITGMLLKLVTLCLLMSGILLGEGIICILMAAPLFYGVAVTVGLAIDLSRWYLEKNRPKRIMALVFPPLLLMSIEGTHELTTFDRDESVVVEKIVQATPAEIEAALITLPDYEAPLPWFLTMGFPHPTATHGTGFDLGDERRIHFEGGEGEPGDMVFEVADVELNDDSGRVRFELVGDDSHIAHWLTWKRSIVRWEAIDDTHTKVSWRVDFDRELDPAWYFAPLERYALTLAADYLIDTTAVPR